MTYTYYYHDKNSPKTVHVDIKFHFAVLWGTTIYVTGKSDLRLRAVRDVVEFPWLNYVHIAGILQNIIYFTMLHLYSKDLFHKVVTLCTKRYTMFLLYAW